VRPEAAAGVAMLVRVDRDVCGPPTATIEQVQTV